MAVDDGFIDRSRQIVSRLPFVRLLGHPPYRRGTGAAHKTGIRAADGEIIVMTVGDGTCLIPDFHFPGVLLMW
jgi:glycosyltransferase involved in cell wall biosynthesis